MWAGPLIFYGHHGRCMNNPIFSILGLCAACWAHSITNCGQHQWAIPSLFSMAHEAILEKNITRKLLIAVFRIVLQYLNILGYFPYILFCRYIFFLLLQVDLLLQNEALFQSGNKLTGVEFAISNDKSTKWVPSLFCVSFLIFFFLINCVLSMSGKIIDLYSVPGAADVSVHGRFNYPVWLSSPPLP